MGDNYVAGSSLALDRNNPPEAFSSCSRASMLLGVSVNPERTGLMRPIEAGETTDHFIITSRVPPEKSLRHSGSAEIRKNSMFLYLFKLLFTTLQAFLQRAGGRADKDEGSGEDSLEKFCIVTVIRNILFPFRVNDTRGF